MDMMCKDAANSASSNEQTVKALASLRANRSKLSRQQIRTLKGQILAGDIIGAMRGLNRIIGQKQNSEERES